MTLGDVIAQFGSHIAGLWPLRTVSEWEQGAHLRAGRVRKLLTSTNGIRGTGVHAFLPLLDDILVMDASIEVAEGAVQTCETADGVSVAFQLAVRYRIVDAAKVYQTIFEVKETVASQARASAGELAGTIYADVDTKEAKDADVDQVGDFSSELADQVYRDLHERFAEWGIELQCVALSSCVFCRAYRLISDGGMTMNLGGGA